MLKNTKNKKPESYQVIPFLQEHNHISPADLEDILESLDDRKYLNEKGKEFKTEFWKMFILNYHKFPNQLNNIYDPQTKRKRQAKR